MTEPNEFKYGYYCVAFLDILGQRRKLRQMACPGRDEQTRRLMSETAAYVLHLRQRFQQTFERYAELSPILDHVPEDARKQIAAAKSSIKYRGFSDSFIVSVKCIGDKEQFAPMTGVFGCISACCIHHLEALAYKRPLRGGIEVHCGVDLTKEGDEVYGPVLERAHFLESQVADYPRIVVGDGLPQYLDVVEREAPATQLGNIARNLASMCKRYLTTDGDGFQMLDFIGEQAAKLGTRELRRTIFKPAAEYIAEQYQYGIDTDDYKHRSRYARLRSYFESRTRTWTSSF